MPTTATVNEFAAYLTDQYWIDTGSIPHAFDLNTGASLSVNMGGLTADGQVLAMAALEIWSVYANISFTMTSGSADITYDDNAGGAVTNVSFFTTGETISANVNVSTAWLSNNGTGVGSYSFQTYLHETSHALGLGHPGDYNSSADYETDAIFVNDSWQMSIMSYFSQTENTAIDASYAPSVTPMMVDIIAMQNLYGAPSGGATAGNTTYGVSANTGTYLDDFFAHNAGTPKENSFTIYDEGGYDHIDFSDDTERQVVDLNGGAFSSVYGLVGNMGLVPDTVIEAYSGGKAWNHIIGNSADNALSSRGGSDTIFGQDGDDSIFGGAGSDQLYGGNDNDYLKGQNGHDTLMGDAGADILFGNNGFDQLYGGAGDDILDAGLGTDSLYGGGGNDQLSGKEGSDVLRGGAGEDVLYGNAGADTLYGESDDDILYGGNNFDELYGGNGKDTLYGNDGADKLRGDNDNDILKGNAGADSLFGGAGNDKLNGGKGADTFIFTEGRDTVLDFQDDIDTLRIDDALWGGSSKTVAEVLEYASIIDGNTVFDFGSGNTLTLNNITDIDMFTNDLVVF